LRELDKKIATMKAGQYLSVQFHIDVLNADGTGVAEPNARTSPEAHAWRKAVFERDGYTCVECGRQGRLQAHHLRSWAEDVDGRLDVDNGITLCLECHKAKHPELSSLIERSRYHDRTAD
jgi:hypothetical protein